MFILGRFFSKYWKKSDFLNNIFRKFEIVVCFALLLHGVERNTILNFDSITEAWNLKIALHGGSEENRRIRRSDESFSRAKSDEEARRAARAAAFPYSLLTDRRCFCSCDCVGIRSEHTALQLKTKSGLTFDWRAH